MTLSVRKPFQQISINSNLGFHVALIASSKTLRPFFAVPIELMANLLVHLKNFLKYIEYGFFFSLICQIFLSTRVYLNLWFHLLENHFKTFTSYIPVQSFIWELHFVLLKDAYSFIENRNNCWSSYCKLSSFQSSTWNLY